MLIKGQYSTDGKGYLEFKEPVNVAEFANTLIDEDGFIVGEKDDYGDWVSPRMKALGLKCKLEVSA
jgi:hypothetical protein